MSPKMMLPIVIAMLLFGAGSAMALSPGTGTASVGHVGNFFFQYNATDSVVTNLQYVHESTDYNLTSQIQVTAATSGLTGMAGPDGSVVLQNATILNTEAENVFLMLTTEMSSNVSMLLNSNLTPANIDLSTQMSSVTNFMSDHMNMKISASSYVYKTDVNGVLFYVFSNVKGSESNGVAYFTSSSSPVLVGVIPFAALLNDYRQSDFGNAPFSYNQTTGALTGRYMSLTLNTTTGNISDLGSPVFSKILFSSISVNATGSIGNGEDSVMLPAGQPVMMGSLFIYSNGSYIYAFHDNPSLQSVIVWNNGTANFTLGSGLKAHILRTMGEDSPLTSQMSTNVTAFANSTLEADHNVEAGRYAVYINGTGFAAFLMVNNGIANISGNSVTIHSSGIAKVTLVVPPGFGSSHLSVSQRIYQAVKSGKIAAEIAIVGANASANITVHFNNTVRMIVSNVTAGQATIHLSSSDHVGTNILIFVSNSVINSNSNLKVTFDGVTLNLNSVDGVLNTTSTTQATFAEIQTTGGVLILLHVPHFSNHTVVISSSGSSTTPLSSLSLGSTGGKLVVVGAVIAIVVIVAAVMTRRKKD